MALRPQPNRSSGWLGTITAATKWIGWETIVAHANAGWTTRPRSMPMPSRIVPSTCPATKNAAAMPWTGWLLLYMSASVVDRQVVSDAVEHDDVTHRQPGQRQVAQHHQGSRDRGQPR